MLLRKYPTVAIVILMSVVTPTAQAVVHVPAADVEGSHDHPLISRFAGSVIVGYQTVDYDRMDLPMGKYVGRKISVMETVEGRITRVAYVAPQGKSALEVYRNYAQAVAAAGFQTRFECNGEDGDRGCGSKFDFVWDVRTPLLDVMHGNVDIMGDTLNANEGDAHALTARLQGPNGLVDISLIVAQYPKYPAGILLQICERQPMATGQVTVDAKAIGEGLAQAGHIALYGISFATDSATLDPASQPTLVQMAKVLGETPALKVYIVGHTDSTGNLAHNLDLSQRRAEAVVAALVKDYRIAPARLAAKGLASYAPVASNDDDAGRARNRRVELVKQ